MKRYFVLVLLLFICLASAQGLEIFQSFSSGYQGDAAGTLGFGIWDLVPSFPIGVRLLFGIVYQLDSGDATAARRIFINDNEGGTIEKWGTNHLLALDLTYRVAGSKDLLLYGFAGPRMSFYSAHFGFIGNNEVFAVRSDALGAGGGLQVMLRLGPRFRATLSGGADYFLPAKLYAHGTFYYTPDGVDQVPRNAYTYQDADAAVNQPRLLPVISLGIEYQLSGDQVP
jgi:hypothetical protein